MCHWNGFLTYQSTKSNEHRQWLSYVGRLIYWESPRWLSYPNSAANHSWIIQPSKFRNVWLSNFLGFFLGTMLGVQEVNMSKFPWFHWCLKPWSQNLIKSDPRNQKIVPTLGNFTKKTNSKLTTVGTEVFFGDFPLARLRKTHDDP